MVMLGHMAEVSGRDGLLSWMGFGFRMPFFIGLSGYLLNRARIIGMPWPSLLGKYWRRMILPWLVAGLFYIIVAAKPVGPMTLAELIVWPPFHLWFVPVLFWLTLLARMLGRQMPPFAMVALFAPVSIAAMYYFGVGHAIIERDLMLPDRRYFVYPLYFAFGMWVAASDPFRVARPWAAMLAGLAALWWAGMYFRPDLAGEVGAKLLLNLSLIALLPKIASWSLKMPMVERVGRESLYFYLWHPIVYALLIVLGLSGVAMFATSMVILFMALPPMQTMPLMCRIMGIQRAEQEAGGPLPDHMAQPA